MRASPRVGSSGLVLAFTWTLGAALGCPSAAVLPTTPSLDPMSDGRPEGCVLEHWTDGDTAEVDCGSGTRERVRLHGVEAAELGFDRASRTRALEQSQLWQLSYATVLRCGRAATARVREICPEGSSVELHGDDTDRDDNRVAFIRCGGKNVNQRMLDEGHAGLQVELRDPQRPRLCR